MGMWKKQTYSAGLEYCFSIKRNVKAYELTRKVLELQGLSDKNMEGSSIQGIPIINENKTNIIFSNIFWNIAATYITPVYYASLIVKTCMEQGINEPKQVAGIVGRGLRALPSFLREMDLTYKLSLLFIDADVENGPEQDVKEHTDIFIKKGDKEYRLWSYQSSTKRGLESTAKRLCGQRGEIPNGYHILCPIDIYDKASIEEVNGWYFYPEQYVENIYKTIAERTPDEYNRIKTLQKNNMLAYLKNINVIHKGEVIING